MWILIKIYLTVEIQAKDKDATRILSFDSTLAPLGCRCNTPLIRNFSKLLLTELLNSALSWPSRRLGGYYGSVARANHLAHPKPLLHRQGTGAHLVRRALTLQPYALDKGTRVV